MNDDLTIKNVFGYNNVLSLESSDLDGSPYDWLQIGGGTALRDQGFNFGTKQWSEELQISGETGRLKYIAGIFQCDENTYSRIPLRILGDLGQPFLGAYSFHVKSKSNAIYGQVNWGLADDLNLSAGLRYTWEDVRIVQDDDSLLLILNQGRNRRKDAKPSWHVGIDYKPAPSLMLYFNHRGSWRTGGFNGSSAAAFPDAATFRPETTYDFELGAKFSGFIGSVQSNINLAIFDQHISDVQRTSYTMMGIVEVSIDEGTADVMTIGSEFGKIAEVLAVNVLPDRPQLVLIIVSADIPHFVRIVEQQIAGVAGVVKCSADVCLEILKFAPGLAAL